MNLYLFLLFAFLSTVAFAQAPADSSDSGYASQSIDTLAQDANALTNADMHTYLRLDSMRGQFNRAADSLYAEYRHVITEVNTQAEKINETIDSIESLHLPTKKYKNKLNKVSDSKRKADRQFNDNLDALKAKTTDKLNTLDLPPEYEEPVQKLTQQINNVTLHSGVIKLPVLKIPGNDMPSLNSINTPSLEGMTNATDLPEVSSIKPPAELKDVTQQIQSYDGQIDKLVNTDAETVQKTIESQASRVGGIDELPKQSAVIDAHRTKIDELADPDKGKTKAAELAKKAAVDHFAGKEEQLKAAMEKISKYKQKYTSVPSIKDLPNRPPNAMKGKPFVERLVPGFYLQYQRKGQYLLDMNPYVGYRLSGKFTTGIGWNQRFVYDRSTRSFNSRTRIFGPRGFVDFKLGKGFIAHVEGEWMNSFVPSTITGNPDTGRREWVFSVMTGLKKEYRIYKNLRGTALIQYNLIDRYYKAPYLDRLNSRIGFEYVLKKKAKKTAD